MVLQVSYDTSGLEAENTSIVPWNCARMFYSSSNQLAKLLFPEGACHTGTV